MLQNQTFENALLQEELSASQTELFVLESINTLNEAEEEKSSSKIGDFAKKAKEFFIKIAEAIAAAFKKFTSFFVETFRKIQSRMSDVESYLKNAKSQVNSGDKLSEPKTYKLFDTSAIKGAQSLKPGTESFDSQLKSVQEKLNDEKVYKVYDFSQAMTSFKAAKDSASRLSNAAASVKQSNNIVQTKAKDGIKAAAKGDKEEVSRQKKIISQASKMNSINSKIASKGASAANSAMAASFSAAKSLVAMSKGNNKENAKAEKKSAKTA